MRELRIRLFRAVLLSAAAGLSFLVCSPLLADTPPAPPEASDSQQLIAFLNQTIDWYRNLAIEQQFASNPTDILFWNDDRQLAKQVVQLSFDFARAEAQSSSASGAQTVDQQFAQSKYQSLFQAAANADAQIQQTQSEINTLEQKLASASRSNRSGIQSTLDELQSELKLAQARNETLRNMLQFVNAGYAGKGNANLSAQVEELQRTVPETAAAAKSSGEQANASPTSNSGSAGTGAPERQQQQPPGIFGQVSDLLTFSRKIHSLDQSLRLTNTLAQSSQNLRTPLINKLTAAVQRGDALAQQADTSDPAALQQEKRELDALTASFRQTSALVLPLGKQGILFDLYKNNLARWRDTVKGQYAAEAKSLSLRLLALALVILAFFALSAIWRRATFRYVHDTRRRYQFLLLRRIVLGFVIAVTLAFAFATEIGSLATFAGLITAGVAVALQNVILAVAGYFFLIGKYGVRVGDRVQISGVTGDVVDIGLVRLHLMEVGGSGTDRQPTGRIVVFSNSIVFQPTASFYKQIPGTNFAWHEVSLTLAPDSDFHVAETRLLGAVEKVYANYKDEMEIQHRQMERTLNVKVALPEPQSRLHLTQTGLEVVIRYPLELRNVAEIDDQITRELLNALKQKPRLKLVGSGTPNIQPVGDGAGGSEYAEASAKTEKKKM